MTNIKTIKNAGSSHNGLFQLIPRWFVISRKAAESNAFFAILNASMYLMFNTVDTNIPVF
jgi:hypothetical protein